MTARRSGTLFFIMVLCYFGASAAIGFFGPWYPLVRNPLVLLLVPQAAILYPVLVYSVLVPEPLGQIFPLRGVRAVTLILSLFALAALFPAILVVNDLSLYFSKNGAASILNLAELMPAWQMFLVVGVLGPLSEELIFRGCILQSLRTSGKRVLPILVSALCFGLIHMNLNQACYAFVFGLALAFTAVMTESILPGLVMHMALNSFQVLLFYLGLAEADALPRAELKAQILLLAPWAAGGFAVFVLLVFAMRALEGRPYRRPEAGDPRILGIGLILGVFTSGGFMLADYLGLLPI